MKSITFSAFFILAMTLAACQPAIPAGNSPKITIGSAPQSSAIPVFPTATYAPPSPTVIENVPMQTTMPGQYACIDPALTPEERANCGTHQYSLHEYTTSKTCSFSEDNTDYQERISTETVEWVFSPGYANSLAVPNAPDVVPPLQKIGLNTYKWERVYKGMLLIDIYIFKSNGYSWKHSDPTAGFCWRSDSTLK